MIETHIIYLLSFSALQRAEIAEIGSGNSLIFFITRSFSALQRAEIAEIAPFTVLTRKDRRVSVLFNEPKLLK